MKNLLCFGDSNTWGFEPGAGRRYACDVRWPGALQRELGAEWRVIEEGLNGRTGAFNDPVMPGRRGLDVLPILLDTHRPLDAVLVALGTNDSKKHFHANPGVIARGMSLMLDCILKSNCGACGRDAATPPRVILIAPPPLGRQSEFAEFFEGSAEKLAVLPAHYRALAAQYGCEFFDAGTAVTTSDIDGVHWEAAEHAKLGAALAKLIRG
ncbi:MAG: SGNH/GDSL hydrolase family protein [Acidobacteriota bacterium]